MNKKHGICCINEQVDMSVQKKKIVRNPEMIKCDGNCAVPERGCKAALGHPFVGLSSEVAERRQEGGEQSTWAGGRRESDSAALCRLPALCSAPRSAPARLSRSVNPAFL